MDFIKKVNSTATLDQLNHLLSVDFQPLILVFHRSEQNIVGVIHSRSLLEVDETKRVVDEAKPPWFITEETYLLDVLKQFRTNNQNIAIVLSSTGEALGVITLENIITDLFGKVTEEEEKMETIIEKTLSGDMTLKEFNKTFNAHLFHPEADTLSDLIYKTLHHHPAKGEIILIEHFEIIVLEPGITGAKTLLVRTI